MTKKMTNFLIDSVILLVFLIASEPDFGGLTVHEWLGVALALGVLIHLLLHWDWIVCVGGQFFKRLWHTSRLKFLVDVLLFISFVAVTASGIMISRVVLPALGLEAAHGGAWKAVHRISADSTLLLVGLHFALNWGWFWAAIKRYLLQPVGRFIRPARVPRPLPAATEKP